MPNYKNNRTQYHETTSHISIPNLTGGDTELAPGEDGDSYVFLDLTKAQYVGLVKTADTPNWNPFEKVTAIAAAGTHLIDEDTERVVLTNIIGPVVMSFQVSGNTPSELLAGVGSYEVPVFDANGHRRFTQLYFAGTAISLNIHEFKEDTGIVIY